MSCGGLQCFRESLGVRKVRGTPMEIDHALILCRLVGLSHRSVQYLCFERRKLVSLAQPDDYREIWKTRHWRTLHSLWHMAPGLLDNSQRVRSSTRNSSFQQVRMAFCCTLASGPARLINAGLRRARRRSNPARYLSGFLAAVREAAVAIEFETEMRSQRSDGRVLLKIRIGIGCGNDDDPEPAAIP